MANEKQMDSELIEELQQRLEALNNEGVMDAGVIDGFLTAYALNPEHPSKHDIYPYIFSEEGDPAALPEDDRILELLDIRLNEIQAALAAKGGLDPVIFPLVDDNDEIITDEEGIEALEPWASGFFFGMMHWREDLKPSSSCRNTAAARCRRTSRTPSTTSSRPSSISSSSSIRTSPSCAKNPAWAATTPAPAAAARSSSSAAVKSKPYVQ